ncbi:MAG TPA: universal stress protein [Conexibacter sp.]|jgi:nucleotide-binding universal stress UspA family protein
MLKRLVTGVDGLDAGRDAAVLSRALAVGDDADVLLCGVWQESLLPTSMMMSPVPHPIDEVERMLLAVRHDCVPRQGRTRPLSGLSVARTLRRVATEEHSDLLVLGSSAKARDGQVRVGRDARHMLSSAPCAVAIAARGLHEVPGFAVRRIVVGVEGSREGEAALEWAASLAHGLIAELTAIAVVDEKIPATTGTGGMELELAHWDETVQREEDHARRLIERATTSGGCDHGEVVVGDPGPELAQAAQAADLLVIGSRRLGALAHVAIGSAAEDLLRDAPCSLVMVPRPPA